MKTETAAPKMPPEPVAVDILHTDGRWYPGSLERWRRDELGWKAYVWWSEGVGLRHVEWIPADRLRPQVGDQQLTESPDDGAGVQPGRETPGDGQGVVGDPGG
jgi:hypothetical protein